jgi:secreted PhoX family phosphatase
VPERYGDLSKGKLYVLGVDGIDGVGQGEWAGPIDPQDVRKSGSEQGGASYQRPEDIEIIGDTLYVAITEGSRDDFEEEKYDGRVIAVNLKTLKVTDFVKPGMNAPVQEGSFGDKDFLPGLDNPDNLAKAPDGRLVIIEDNLPSKIWFAQDKDQDGVADDVRLFGLLTDPDAEGTGIYFSPLDPSVLYVNVQHSAAEDGDATWAISQNSN